MTRSKRNLFFDALKYLAIFLVVWGHIIQHTCMLENVFDDYILRLIYTVHMPLLMGISGYFLAKVIRQLGGGKYLSLKLPQRIITLLIPMCSFGFLKLFFISDISLLSIFRSIHDIWFLGALIINYLIAVFVIQFCNGIFSHDCKLFIMSLPLTLLPFIGYSGKGFFMYVFFVFGYCLSYYYDGSFFEFEKYWKFVLLIYVASFYLFDIMPFKPASFTINFFKISLTEVLVIDILKVIMALCGCYLIVLMLYIYLPKISGTQLASHIFYYGQHTLDIYLLQIIIVEVIGERFYYNYVEETGVNIIYAYGFWGELLITFVITVVMMLFLTFISDLINKNAFLTKVLFGRVK